MEKNENLQVIARKRDSLDLSSYTFGKIPPQARELEEAVIGAMMLEANAVPLALSVLKDSGMFYVNEHQTIFSAIVNLFSRNQPVDILTVVEELKRMGRLEDAGGPFAITELTARIASGANVEYHARIIMQKWVQRERIRLASETIRVAYEDTDDALDGIGDDVNKFNSLLNDISIGKSKTFKQSVDETFKQIAISYSQKDDEKFIIGLSTGVYDLDRKTLGYNAPDFILIAGRPKHGKTTLAIISALHNAKQGHPEGIFSMEMSENQLILKMAALESGIAIERIRLGSLSDDEWKLLENTQDMIRELPIYIYDRRGLTLEEASAISKGWKAKYGVKKFSFDYIQLMSYHDRKLTREQQVSEISRGLKRLAGDVNAPVVAVAALSRNLETRSGWDKRPKDSDLREGGSLEYDPDMIIYSFRPENVQLESFQDGSSTTNAIELIVNKNRLGSLGIIRQSVNNGTGCLIDYSPVQKFHSAPKVNTNPYEAEKDDETPFG